VSGITTGRGLVGRGFLNIPTDIIVR